MAAQLRNRHHWIFALAALAVWLAVGWQNLQALMNGTALRGSPVPTLWLVPFLFFGAAALCAMVLKVRPSLQWTLLCAQVAAVVAMAAIFPSGKWPIFLVLTAWQVAMATTTPKALGWVVFQTLAVFGALALSLPNFDRFFILLALTVFSLEFVLQLLFVFTAHALRREAGTARALAQTNRELQSAQAIIAKTARDSERLRISRELHDAWGHDLTALGLQLEIASHVTEPARENDHVAQAKSLARALLAKVRDAVGALRETERREASAATDATPSALRLQVTSGGDEVRLASRGDGGIGSGPHQGSTPPAPGQIGNRQQWIFCIAALAVWLALGWPVFVSFMAEEMIRERAVSALWFVPYTILGAAIMAAMVLKLRANLLWTLLCVQVAAVAAMALIVPWAGMTPFLVIVAWQVAMATGLLKALSWVALQTLAVIGALALAPNPDLCWVIGKSFALQLFIVFIAQALRREAEAARALAQTNRELKAAQAIIANTVRDAERLRISRELHDAWGHELTALGLQLEIASHVTEPGRAGDHVLQAKGLARGLLAKVRDVVGALREAELCDLKDALESLAQSVPTPVIHVEISPGVRVSPDQAHALMRCAQEAVTNAVRHAKASNLWLQVTADGEGVRLMARNDGSARATASSPGSGLLGMRERVEHLGGKLAVRAGGEFGFTVDAWLPSRTPRAA